MPRLASSNIANVTYDEQRKVLTCQFAKTGAIYEYLNVPKEIYNGIMTAPSAGEFLNTSVKGIYEYRRVA